MKEDGNEHFKSKFLRNNLNLYFNVLTSIIGFVITGLTYREIGFSGYRGDHKRPEDHYSDKIAEEISSDQVFVLWGRNLIKRIILQIKII